MTIDSPISTKNVYIYVESHIVRTGILKYYTPLLISDMLYKTLTQLNTVNSSLPSSDPTSNIFPTGINASLLNLIIEV
jgi:Gpi18-like mannosyltransferase